MPTVPAHRMGYPCTVVLGFDSLDTQARVILPGTPCPDEWTLGSDLVCCPMCCTRISPGTRYGVVLTRGELLHLSCVLDWSADEPGEGSFIMGGDTPQTGRHSEGGPLVRMGVAVDA